MSIVDIPLEKKFKILSEIARAQHFAWRQAVEKCYPDADPEKAVFKMWEITGHETAKAYLKRLDRSKPLPKQLADSLAWSSVSMGEDAVSLQGRSEKEALKKIKEAKSLHVEVLNEEASGKKLIEEVQCQSFPDVQLGRICLRSSVNLGLKSSGKEEAAFFYATLMAED